MIFKWNLVFVAYFIEYQYFTLREILWWESHETSFMLNLDKLLTISPFIILKVRCIGPIKTQNFVYEVSPKR